MEEPKNGKHQLKRRVIKFFDYGSEKQKEIDPCDCPYANCPGCWYECKKCGSNKCSHFCRVGRKHKVEWKMPE